MEYRIGLLGSGNLGKIIATALADGKIPSCKLVGILGSGMERSAALAEQTGSKACRDLQELLDLKPHYILEAATGAALKQHAAAILAAGSNLISLSNGAYNDESFTAELRSIAMEQGTHLYMAPGVTGGFDLACAAALCGDLEATLTKFNYPKASGKRPAGLMELPDDYEGSVREAYEMSPRHLNIGIGAGYVCGSLEKTRLQLKPTAPGQLTGFELVLKGDFGEAVITVRQGGETCKLRGPALAAWSALAVLKRETDPITY